MRRPHSYLLRIGGLLLVLGWVVASIGAVPIDVVRVRASRDSLSHWFPPGTELRSLTTEELDKLVSEAETGLLRANPKATASIVRIDHEARWEAGMLVGRSKLILRVDQPVATWIPLGKWSPAIEKDDLSTFRTDEQGLVGLFFGREPPTAVEVEWRQRARANSAGRVFSLSLPNSALSRFSLDLPPELTAEFTGGKSSEASKTISARRRIQTWTGIEGDRELTIRPADPPSNSATPRSWTSGPTIVEVEKDGAHWSVDWTIDFLENSDRSLEFELDAPLELIDVRGTNVSSFSTRPTVKGLRGVIHFAPSSTHRERVSVIAICQVPMSAIWTVPAARPLESLWLGGRTTVRVESTRTVVACRVRSGRRVASNLAATVSKPAVFSIDPTEPVAVADLTLGHSNLEGSVAINGLLRLEEATPRMLVQARWSPRSGAVPYYALEFPADWSVTRVELDGDDEPLPWRSETITGGRSRLILTAPLAEAPTQAITFNIHAVGRIDVPSGPLELPRVRAIGAIRDDECWVALTRSSDQLKPTFTRSLAWLKPDEVLTRLPKLLATRGPNTKATAWRWLGDDGEGRAEVNPAPNPAKASVLGQATFVPGRMELDWKVKVDGASSEQSIVVQVDPAPPADPVWTTGDPARRPLVCEPIAPGDWKALGLGNTGAAWRIYFAKPDRNSTILLGRVGYAFEADGPIPLLFLSDAVPSKLTQVVRSSAQIAPTFRTIGLEPLSTDAVSARSIDEFAPDTTADSRRVAVYAYEGRSGQLSIQSTKAVMPRLTGLIQEAVQTTIIEPGGNRRDRLLLQVAYSDDSGLRLSCPPGLVIDRVTRDGQVVEVTQTGETVLIPLGIGNGPRTIVVDYHRILEAESTPDRIQANRPLLDLPCVSFVWEVTAPERLTVRTDAEELRAADIAEFDSRTLLQRLFAKLPGHGLPTQNSEDEKTPPLDGVASTPELTLVEALLCIDSARTQIVVDRLALLEIGLGPRSKLPISPRQELRGGLENLGLILVRREAATLVTTSRNRPKIVQEPEIHSRLQEAMLTGSDRDDRFQTIERWRGEPTPRGYRSIASEFWISKENASNGWATHRFMAPTWPKTKAALLVCDTTKDTARQWVGGGFGYSVALLVLASSRRMRFVLFALLSATTMILTYQTSRDWSMLGTGGTWGLAFALALHLGRSRKPKRTTTYRERSTTRRVLPRAVGVIRLVFILAVVGSVGSTSLRAFESSRRILVLLPYETLVGAASPARQALIRLEDDLRLRDWAKLVEHRAIPIVTLLEATHRVTRSSDDSASLESSHEIEVQGNAPASWSFPIGDQVELSAFVDEVESPLLISDSGREGIIRSLSRGRHRIRVVRLARLSSIPGSASIDVPIANAARARVEVSQTKSLENRRWVDIPTAHGELKEVAGRIVGSLGPAERLVVSWRDDDGKTREGSGPAESVVLWDSTPAGDLARVRLTLNDPAGTPSVRLAIDPGTSVRPTSIPGLVSLTIEGSPLRPEWVVKMDPPLAPGSTIGFELWRPIGVHRALPSTPAQEPTRSPPGFFPVGLAPYSGIVGLRRPSDWHGRLKSPGAVELSLEESFATTWGLFPDDSLTFAGVLRFVGEPLVVVSTGPVRTRPTSRSSIIFELTEARAEVKLETKLQDSGGDIAEAELAIPEGFHLRDVRADALTAIHSVNPSQLLLRFDGKPSRSRDIVLTGWMEARMTPTVKESRRYAINFPLFRWVGFAPEPTVVTLKGETKFDLEAPGLLKKEPITEVEKTPVETTSVAWTLGPSTESVSIRWNAAATKLVVTADNTLTVSDDGFSWVAQLDYQIEGNPLEVLYLKVPNAWSDKLRVETPNQKSSTHSEVRGDFTYLTIKPEAPAWGFLALRVLAQKPFDPSGSVDFPELTPLGQGRTETRISLIRTTHRRVQWETSPTLVPLVEDAANPTRRHPAVDSPSMNNFRVAGQPWSLRIKVESDARSPQPYPQAKVLQASFFVDRLEDGSSLGQALLDVEPIPGRFVALEFPGQAELFWAVVDGKTVQPIRTDLKTWFIPIEQAQTGRVVVCWEAFQSEAETSSQTIFVPSLRQPGVPFLVSAYGGAVGRFRSGNLSMEPIRESVWWTEAADRRFRGLTAVAPEVNKSSNPGRDALLGAIIEALLTDRQARLSLRFEGESFRKVELSRLDDSAAALESGLRKLGLETLRKEALARVGLAGPGSSPLGKASSLDLVESVRLRRVGSNLQRFRGIERAGIATPLLLFEPSQASTVDRWRNGSIGLGVWALLLGIVWTSSNSTWREKWLFRVSLSLIGTACLFVAPFALAIALLGFYAIGCVLHT